MKFVLYTFLFLNLSVLTNADEIKIGATLHLTGDLAMQSAAFREGIEVAVEQINKTGINGKKIKLIIEDGQNSSKYSNTATRKLVYTDKVLASILSSYFDVMASGLIYEKEQIPAIALWDTSPEIEEVGDYIFGIGPWTPSSGEVSAEFAVNNLKAKSAVILNNNDSWSEYVAKAFDKKFKQLGGRVLKFDTIAHDNIDFKTLITKIKSLNPDVLYSPLVVNVPSFYKRLKELAFRGKVISSDVIAEEHILQAPKAFEGIYHSNLKNPNSDTFDTLEKLYLKKFNKPIKLGWFVAVGYDGMMLLAQAIERAGNNSQKIQEELYKIKDMKGASSIISIDFKGSSPQYPIIYVIKNGQFMLAE